MTSSSHPAGTQSEPIVLGFSGSERATTIGVSLPTRFVAGASATNALEGDWVDMYGSFDACITRLRELGVRSVELRDIREHTDPDDVVHALDTLRDAGMGVSLHLWLPNEAHELDPLAFEVERVLAADGVTVRAVLHGHSAPDEEHRSDAVDRTVDSLTALCAALRDRDSPLEVVLELCRHKPGGPVGTTYHELVSIRDRVGAPELGLCWDLGHARSNHVAHDFDALPRADFLACVRHTHIHDLAVDGRTHGPLAAATGPLREAVRLLARSGYHGIYDLELEPRRWGMPPREARSAVERSVGMLREMLEGAE